MTPVLVSIFMDNVEVWHNGARVNVRIVYGRLTFAIADVCPVETSCSLWQNHYYTFSYGSCQGTLDLH